MSIATCPDTLTAALESTASWLGQSKADGVNTQDAARAMRQTRACTYGASVESYRLVAANGRHIRWATRVRFEDGQAVSFMERMPKGLAIRQAVALRNAEVRS